MVAPQVRHLPRKTSQLTSGKFSNHASVRAQERQCDGGWLMDSPSGRRVMQTFKKLPNTRPSKLARAGGTKVDGVAMHRVYVAQIPIWFSVMAWPINNNRT